MSDRYTSTIEADEVPGLTLDAVLEARERLKPIIYYRTSEYFPILDSDGDPVVVCLSERIFEPVDAHKETMTVYMHPENLPAFLQIAYESGCVALARD